MKIKENIICEIEAYIERADNGSGLITIIGFKRFLDLLKKRNNIQTKKFKMHFLEKDGRYACNKACGTTKNKSTKVKGNVTCKNCINSITFIPLK